MTSPIRNEMIAIMGHRGSGKSTWLFRNINQFEPFVLVDPMYDEKYQKLNLYHLPTIEDGLDLFSNGHPKRIYISPNLQTFDLFCGMILAHGNMTLVIDEVDHYSNSYYLSPYFKKIINLGRHRNVSLITICRRPKSLNPTIRGQANRFIIFPMGGEDIRELQSYMPREAIEEIVTLKETINKGSEYIDFDFRTKITSKKYIAYVTKL